MSERTLNHALQCLHSLGPDLVLVGGAAQRLFPAHELGTDPGFELLTTEDVDLAVALEVQHDDSSELLSRLLAAGFTEEVAGAESPAYTYHLRGDEPAYLQFIAPRSGSGVKRSGERDALLRFSGIHAEKLRHAGVLLERPWTLPVSFEGDELDLWIVNPVAFLTQKLLVLPDRHRRQGKDLLYIFDTLVIFSAALDELRERAPKLVRRPSAKAASSIRRAAHDLCFQAGAASREAATIAAAQRQNPPDSKQIVEACELGLRRVLDLLIPGL